MDIECKLNHDPDLFLVAKVAGEVVRLVLGGYDGHRGSIYYRDGASGLSRSRYRQHVQKLGYEIQDNVLLGKRLIEDQEY